MNEKTTETLNRDTQSVLRGEPGSEAQLRKDASAAGVGKEAEDTINAAQGAKEMGIGNDLAAAGANFDGTIGGEPGDPAPTNTDDDGLDD